MLYAYGVLRPNRRDFSARGIDDAPVGLVRVGDLEVARTGLCTTQAEDGGFDFRTEQIEGTTKAGYFPGAAPIAIKLITERGDKPKIPSKR